MAVVPLVLAVLAAVATPVSKADVHSSGVNLYLGDASAVFGYVPAGLDGAAAEQARVRGHLLFVHDLLAARDTAGWPVERRAARARNLERLHSYALAGQFPHNDDHADRFRPTFADNAGTLCAVGALFAADRGRAAAARIAVSFKYAFIAQIDDAELAAWQQDSGLSTAELGMIQPSYREGSDTRPWLPFGLLDRVQIAPARASATTELGTRDHFDTATTTLHAQVSTSCDCNFGAYGTLPLSINLADAPTGVAPAGGPIRSGGGRTSLGTADVGVFVGSERGNDDQAIYRLGFLLPTATATQPELLASARVGESVLALPRTAGVRISTSRLEHFRSIPSSDIQSALRGDLGLDVAAEYANAQHERIVHVIPRLGVGTMLACDMVALSFDTALALDPLVDFKPRLRWSAGITGRIARKQGGGTFLQPAITLATVRTPEGWGGTIAFELAASGEPRQRF
jgi:hypothetical protein